MKFEHSRMCLLACALVGASLGAVGCVSTDDPKDKNTSGTSSTAGTGSSTGGSGTSGSSGSSATGGGGSASVDPLAVACPAASVALLTDFTFMDDGTAAAKTTATFGDFTNTFSGGTFVYPAADKMYPLTSDVTEDNWHMTGDIGDYSGFGLFFNNCAKVDASAFKGISFTISGSLEMEGSMKISVGSAGNEVASAWLVAHNVANDMNMHGFGRCTPASDNQYDGSCNAASKSFAVTAEPTTVTVLWADLTGGKPEASVNPAEITSIAWAFPAPPGAGTATSTPYKADIIVDDLKFVE